MIPYICPDLPDKQKDALKYGVKVPLVYTGVRDQEPPGLRQARRAHGGDSGMFTPRSGSTSP